MSAPGGGAWHPVDSAAMTGSLGDRGGLGDPEQQCLSKVWAENLQANRQVGSPVEIR